MVKNVGPGGQLPGFAILAPPPNSCVIFAHETASLSFSFPYGNKVFVPSCAERQPKAVVLGCGPGTSSISSTWQDLDRNAYSQAQPRPAKSETLGAGPSTLLCQTLEECDSHWSSKKTHRPWSQTVVEV